ncbi:hypothetical protein [Brachybacterium kimchii]|uniref:Uncharacterized protein n=1 Tax=Brachybacterium kimchii TaxID=2942909 RepID=A0ABY4N589_9MICO|nr:hypothetical protein [Brachybacterium kimchii]UQN28270.1 hypothetical protein M4486_11480 [Brachybacterium kimchii]
MYVESMGSRGKPPDKKKDLRDLLRLTLASVEVSATRREVLDEVARVNRLPKALKARRHAVYETSVVYEFSQLARSDFEAHGNTALWERPILNPATGRVQNIDMSLFRTAPAASVFEGADTRDGRRDVEVETRIEFGKFDGTLAPGADEGGARALMMSGGRKLTSDAKKLHLLSGVHAAGSGQANAVPARVVENFVVLWKELDSRVDGAYARLTRARVKSSYRAAELYARSVSAHLQGVLGDPRFQVKLEASAGCSLSTYRDRIRRSARAVHRSAYAMIFSLPTDTPNNRTFELPPRAEVPH